MPSLALVRHAKSGYPSGVADHDRPLAERGERDAPGIGVAINEQFGVPDLVLVSSAARTQQTWGLASQAWSPTPPARIESQLYDASPAQVLAVLRHVPSSVGTLVLVGHLPGVTDLAAELGSSDTTGAIDRLRTKFPTSGVALFDVSTDWPTCTADDCRLLDFVVCRG